ncbi:MAG: hypothetical protein BGO07_00235 [Alphaproteobacteria bacterium 40-19]|nr:MAG: hypothetical protein BGO07_00235 [Alphaproteobacteria bacterium 40-19]
MNKQLFLLILFIFSHQAAFCADPCEVHSDKPWLSSVKSGCVDSFGYPSEQKVWGEESLEYQVLDGKIKEMFGIVPYEQVIALCDNFSHRPLKGKCQFKVRQRLYQEVQKAEPAFASERTIDRNSSLKDVVYESFMGIKNHGSPSQVCRRNSVLPNRLEEITNMSYNGLCQEYLLALRDRMIE